MDWRLIFGFVLTVLLITCCGCGGRLYNVAPLPSTAPTLPPANKTNSFNIGAKVLDGDLSLERFDANLPLAGVIAVDVQLANQTSAAINSALLKFELRNAGGKPLKPLTPKNALKRVMRFYGNSFYRIDARQRTIESYEATGLPLASAISAQEERRGILFFETGRGTTKLDGLTLSISGGTSPISIKLN